MNKEDFRKGINGLKNIRLTEAEKTRMLERVFSAPIKSPYMKRVPVFVSCLILVLSFSVATYASGASLPGDILYPMKIKVVEPMLDVVNSAPEKKIVWEGEKVTRRIVEAEKLAEKDELDDERLEELERRIEKSSTAFAEVANIIASSTATSTLSARERAKGLRQELRKKINEDKDDGKESSNKERGNQREKIKRLRDTAVRVLDDESQGEDDD